MGSVKTSYAAVVGTKPSPRQAVGKFKKSQKKLKRNVTDEIGRSFHQFDEECKYPSPVRDLAPKAEPNLDVWTSISHQRSKPRAVKKWASGNLGLSSHEQDVVNAFYNGVRVLGNRARLDQGVVSKNTYALLRHDGSKQPKHAQSNLAKVVEQVSANLPPKSSEPGSNVGSSLPSQWSIDEDVVRLLVKGDLAAGFETKIHDQDYGHDVIVERGKRLPAFDVDDSDDESEDGGDAPLLTDRKTPGTEAYSYRERRLVDVNSNRDEIYKFAYLDFIGWWNGTRFSQSAIELFAKHVGFHFHDRDVEIRLPGGLVSDLKRWWNHRERDEDGKNFLASVSHCQMLTSELALSSEELRIISLYAPAIAFVESWDEQQNVSRVVRGKYARSSLRESVTKNLSAMGTKTFRRSAVAAGVLSVIGIVGCYFAVAWCKTKALTMYTSWKAVDKGYMPDMAMLAFGVPPYV